MPAPPPARPSFSDAAYWDTRFTSQPAHFDWLLPADESRLDALIRGALALALASASASASTSAAAPPPHILHIGCGTSALSLRLRDFVRCPSQVHNTDFSRVAIDEGVRAEAEAEAEAQSALGSSQRMQWSTLDALSLEDVRALLAPPRDDALPRLYTLILDKSTSDAISCGPDVRVGLPYPPGPASAAATSAAETPSTSTHLHPLHVLALHLALVTAPGGTWLAISYSSVRFPFLEPFPLRQDEGRLEWDDERVCGCGCGGQGAGFTHPGRLWELESKEGVGLCGGESGDQGETGAETVGTPPTVHWVYVLRRTEVPVR